MEQYLKNKKDVATETSEFEIDFSSSSSSSSSTLREDSVINKDSSTLTYKSVSTISTEVKKKQKKLRKSLKSNQRVSEIPLDKPHSKEKYDSSTNTSSIRSLNIIRYPTGTRKEAAISAKIKGRELTNSSVPSSSTLTGESFILSSANAKEGKIIATDSHHKSDSFVSALENIAKDSSKEFETTKEQFSKISKEDTKPDPKEESLSSAVSLLVTNLTYDPPNSESNKKSSIVTVKDTTLRFAEKDEEAEPRLKSSKSRHVRKITSSEEDEEEKEPPAFLKSSKSQHVRKVPVYDDDDDSEDSDRESTNLQIGHVFVYMVIPPDGGYGWLITFISFLCQVVVDGIIFSIGIVLPHIAKEMNIPGSEVVLVASMQVGFYFLSGTVSSAFINKFGFRPVALAGCLLSIVVLTISTFSINLPMMIFFYSVLGGPALSMIWVSSQLIIGYYFDKYRPIANGASCSGAGAGIMLFSYMNSVLVPNIGWRNLMRVHVGFLIVVLIMALTFIEVAPTRIGRVKETLAEDTESESFDLLTSLTQYSRYSLKIKDQEYPLDDDFETVTENPKACETKKSSYCWQKCCPSLYKYWQKHQEEKAQQEATKRYVIKQDLIERQDLFYMGPKDHKKEQRKVEEILQKRASQPQNIATEQCEMRTISLEEFDNKYKRHTIINTLSTMHMIRDQDRKKDHQTYKELKEKEKHPLLAFLSPKNLIHPKIRKAFSLLFDFRLLSIMEFRILLLSAFLFPMGFNIPFVYSTVRVQIDASFAKLISPTIGFSNFAFRIASGFVAFKFREYTTYICGGGMFFGGVAVLVSAFYGLDVVWFQFVYAMCYGIAPAFYSTLRAIIYVRSLGLDKLTNAFGLTALAMGMGVFIGTTAGGILNDFTGSYTASFIFAGICICASGALKLVLPYLIKLSQDKDEGK